MRTRNSIWLAGLPLLAVVALPIATKAQGAVQPESGLALAGGGVELDSLLTRAVAVNPEIGAARERIEAVRARIRAAGTWPDPMVGVGMMNLPASDPGSGDFMTMKTVAIGQSVPFPGKLSLAQRVAQRQLAASEARLRATELDVVSAVQHAYYDLAFLDRAMEMLRQNQSVLVNFIQITEARYGVGSGGQQDVLKARLEATRNAEEAGRLTEQRNAVLAHLNALLDRPSESAVTRPEVPERIARAAVAASPTEIRFTSGALGARVTNSPLPPLERLQERAIENNPLLRVHEAEIDAQAARVELAQKAHLPDFDLSLQYGQRTHRMDMVSLMVSMPVPVWKGAKQDQHVLEGRAELAALESEHRMLVNRLRADVAARHAELERGRTQLALFVKSIIPQGRAALESATSSFQVGRIDFLTLLESQTTLYSYETAYFRALAEFAKSVADLERIVGEEVL